MARGSLAATSAKEGQPGCPHARQQPPRAATAAAAQGRVDPDGEEETGEGDLGEEAAATNETRLGGGGEEDVGPDPKAPTAADGDEDGVDAACGMAATAMRCGDNEAVQSIDAEEGPEITRRR